MLAEKRTRPRATTLIKTQAISENIVDQRRQALAGGAGRDAAGRRCAEGQRKLNVEYHQGGRADHRPRQPPSRDSPATSCRAARAATLLTSIVSLDPIYIYFDVDEATYSAQQQAVVRGQAAELARYAQSRAGDADRRDQAVARGQDGLPRQPARRLAPARCAAAPSIPNKDLSILPGQFGRVRVIGSAPYEALLMPDTAIATDQSRKIVFVVKADNTVGGAAGDTRAAR